jgi:hypothetical protein
LHPAHPPALARRTHRRLVQRGSRCGGRRPRRGGAHRRLEPPPAPLALRLAAPVREQPIMAEALEAGGQDRQPEAPAACDGIQGQQSLTVAMGIVFPPQGHPPILEGQPAPMRDRHALGRARELLQHRPRATHRGRGLDHPCCGPAGAQARLPPRVRSEEVASPRQRQSACRVRRREPGQEETTAHPTQDTDWEEDGRSTGLPLCPVGGPPARRDDTVERGMGVQGVPPGLQHREAPAVGAQLVRLACHGPEGLSHGLQEERVAHPRVVERARTAGMRAGKPAMDGGHVEPRRCTRCQPGGWRPAWTLGTVPLATRVSGERQVATLVTLGRVPSQGGGAADRSRPERAVRLRGPGGTRACQRGGARRA